MASEVEICNLALGNIRARSINSLDEPSVQAQTCKLRYPLMRDFLLKNHPWQFAHGLKPLSVLTVQLFNRAYAYQYPADCLHINRLVGGYEEVDLTDGTTVVSQYRPWAEQFVSADELRQQIPYEVFNSDDNQVIGADEAELRIDYRRKVTDPNLFSSAFIVALSHLLGAEIAIPIVGSELGRTLRSDSYTLYQSYIDNASMNDMNEQYHPPGNSEYVNIRR